MGKGTTALHDGRVQEEEWQDLTEARVFADRAVLHRRFFLWDNLSGRSIPDTTKTG